MGVEYLTQGIWGPSTQEVKVGSQELQASLCHQLVLTFPRATCLAPKTVTSNRTNNPGPWSLGTTGLVPEARLG